MQVHEPEQVKVHELEPVQEPEQVQVETHKPEQVETKVEVEDPTVETKPLLQTEIREPSISTVILDDFDNQLETKLLDNKQGQPKTCCVLKTVFNCCFCKPKN